jgi:RNA polymerase sigma factor (sigma-70 family)
MTPQSVLAPARLAGQPVLRSQSDERLVDLVRAGHDSAFEAVVARYRRALMRYCSRLLTEERAEDAVQQTFVKAYGAMKSSDAELNLKPWLYRIAHNTSLNVLRDRSMRYEQLDENFDGVERPDQVFERRQGLREVLTAVQSLPERQRDALVLRELEGRSYDEIASELGVTGGAVRQLLNRARTTLRSGASAVTPVGLLSRLPLSGESEAISAPVAETVGGAGVGAVAAKLCATALVTGAVVGGVATVPDRAGRDEATAAQEAPAARESGGSPSSDPSQTSSPASRQSGRAGESGDADGRGHSGRRGSSEDGGGHHGSDDRGRGPSGESGGGSGSNESGSDGSHSGSGRSGSEEEGHSGSGSSGEGSGGSGSGSSGSGSSDSSGSGSSGSGSSGSGDSGSGDRSGSGSGDSGSGDSLSDSSGSGSSGSGSSGSG